MLSSAGMKPEADNRRDEKDGLDRASSTALQAAIGDIAVVAVGDGAREVAEETASALGLPMLDSRDARVTLRLLQSSIDLVLHDSTSGAKLRVEFTGAQLLRYRAGGDPLRRAVGPGRRHVADATAGFGGDAVHLAALGHWVTAIERNAIVSALGRDGLRRARADGLLDDANPEWRVGDACVILPRLDPPPATVYLDPMFPPKRKKSAAVRKEMNLLRRLGIDDADALALLAVARAVATDRVVVKRPIAAPPLANGASAAYRGRLIRYDVYPAQRARP